MKNKLSKMTEKQVLRTLDIPDFRHLSKEKVMTFFSMIPQMDPEVAKKALEQFPNFSSSVREILQDYKNVIEKGLIANSSSTQAYYDASNTILAALQPLLDKQELSFEEKKYIIDQMVKIQKDISKKDTENKKFVLTVLGGACVAIIAAIGGLAAVLGAASGISLPQDDEENHEEKE